MMRRPALSHSYGLASHHGLGFFEGAAMAAITLNTVHHPRQPLATQRPATSMMEKTEFQPLDPDIVSASIPAFFIGRNRAGFWVAREAKGRTGGIFLLKSSAVHFAHVQSTPARDIRARHRKPRQSADRAACALD
jgi:hypothetical protein